MTLKLFLAICILGLDVLIYILFQWTLGEKGRTSRRRPKAKRRLETGQETELVVVHPQRHEGVKRAKILQYPKSGLSKQTWPNEDCGPEDPMTEEMAHRRRAAAFAASKQNTKLAV